MFNFTANNRNFFMTEGTALLNKYGHETAEKGMTAIWEEYSLNKAPVADILSRHPNWDPDTLSVHLTEEYSTSIDHDKVEAFCGFLQRRLRDWCKTREIKIAGMSGEEVCYARDRLREVMQHMNSIPQQYQPVTCAGRTMSDLQEDLTRLNELNRRFYFETETMCGYSISNDNYKKASAIKNIVRYISHHTENVLDESFAEALNNCAVYFFPVDENGEVIKKARFSAGMKTSKAVSKFFSLAGDHFVKFKDIQETVWMDQSGNFHTREKDMGWNHFFSAYADGINPIKVKRHTYISVNPLDYLTMSFGNGWASCHTIDHNNNRPNNGRHTYEGCYQSGTLSYMLDGSSIVMYTTKEDIDTTCPWEADKINRCMFHLGEEKFVQGRTYPDGRDNPDNEEAVTIASTFRNIFQRVISECLDVPNMWVIKRNNGDYTASFGTHYRDYLCYSDTLTCILKGNENNEIIRIGHDPICPVCGEEHSNESSLHCGDDHECYHNGNYVFCERCGARINLDHDDYIRDEDTGDYYCDYECAEARDVFYCANVDEAHSEDVYYDEYAEEWFYDPNEEHVITENGYHFMTEDNAIEAGYIQDEDGDWVRA